MSTQCEAQRQSHGADNRREKKQQRSIPLSRVGFSDIYSGIQEKGDEPIEDMSNGIEPWVSGVLRQQIT